MKREEFGTLVKGMKAVYSDPRFIPDQDAFNVWYNLLSDLDYRVASIALQRHMMTSDYPPKPADIRKQCRNLTEPKQLDGMEAWSLVAKAIRNSAYNEVAEFEALPPLVQKAIGSPGNLHSMAIDENYNEGVARSNFLRQYQILCEREQEEACIPKEIRLLTEETMKRLTEHLEEQRAGNDEDEETVNSNGDGSTDGGRSD